MQAYVKRDIRKFIELILAVYMRLILRILGIDILSIAG